MSRLARAILGRGNFLEHGVVGGLRLVGAVKRKGCTLGPMGMRSDPRVFVGKSPRLNRGAAGTSQASPNDAAVDLSLAKKIVVSGGRTGVHRQGHVEFRDM